MSFSNNSWKTLRHIYKFASGLPLVISGAKESGEDDGAMDAFGLHYVSGEESFQWKLDDGFRSIGFWLGGKDDLLITMDEATFSINIANPVLRTCHHLPSLSNAEGVLFDVLARLMSDDDRGEFAIKRAALCRTPRHARGFCVVIMFNNGVFFVTQSWDERWHALDVPAARHGLVDDVIQLGSQIVAITRHDTIILWNLDRLMEPATVVEGPLIEPPLTGTWTDHCQFLAKGTGNKILVIRVHGQCRSEDSVTLPKGVAGSPLRVMEKVDGVLIYEQVPESSDWNTVQDLGPERSLFIGLGHTFFFDLPPKVETTIKPNKVYVSGMFDASVAVFHVGVLRRHDQLYDRIQLPIRRPALQPSTMFYRPSTSRV